MPNAISSPESADGPSQHEWPDGTTLDLFGLAPRHVSHSARLAKGKEPMIQGICGRTFIGSSTPSGPMSSWENKLRDRLAMIGSTESALIWKPVDTNAGRSISRLAPSTLHSNGNEYIGPQSQWRSPASRDKQGSLTDPDKAKERIDGNHQTNLEDQMVAGLWNAPLESDVRKQSDNPETTVKRMEKGQQIGLNAQMKLHAQPKPERWPAVVASDGGQTSRGGDRQDEPLMGGLMAGLWTAPAGPVDPVSPFGP